MKEKLIRFMQGRYGVDSLSKVVTTIGFIALIVGMFSKTNIVYWIGWVLIIYAYYRMFSKNIGKRQQENQLYLDKTYKLRCKFAAWKNRLAQGKNYHIYACPSCKQKIRIPRGKGKIEVRCPKCGTTFMKRS
ncbi:MAG: hypothetical protein PHW34_01550 [Hespellia sp.]|nr:hypothetical protein [Hespellia sp.]